MHMFCCSTIYLELELHSLTVFIQGEFLLDCLSTHASEAYISKTRNENRYLLQ